MDKNRALQSAMSAAAEEGMEGNRPQTTTLGQRKRESNVGVGLNEL